jgi:hypothetical protein
VLSRSTLDWLDPLAGPHGRPHTLQESKTSSSSVATVVASHNRLDRLGRLVCVVEWNRADIVVEDVGLDDTVQELAADEAEFTIDSGRCTAGIVPAGRGVVRKAGISVLEEGDGNYSIISIRKPKNSVRRTNRASD